METGAETNCFRSTTQSFRYIWLKWDKKYEKGRVRGGGILKKKDSKNKLEMENHSKIHKKGGNKGKYV
jgi:hypothetical protein